MEAGDLRMSEQDRSFLIEMNIFDRCSFLSFLRTELLWQIIVRILETFLNFIFFRALYSQATVKQ